LFCGTADQALRDERPFNFVDVLLLCHCGFHQYVIFFAGPRAFLQSWFQGPVPPLAALYISAMWEAARNFLPIQLFQLLRLRLYRFSQ
jgi:hypothetical protein